ncbi:cardiolipin synthase [Wohlfahrtiimonas chitiniclastica]|uniref:cardiolipin synthase n=1 Tax=Wohlfahrtiimonas chitiniclastica TaxID=400946 RepID=UPI0003797E32|nr:cardiolipin synthase [Wohlfahrtiimonas chitiniclastica]
MQALFDDIITNWGTYMGVFTILYFLAILTVTVIIINNEEGATKTLGYLTLIWFVPLFGVVLYFSLGVNYRNNQMYSKKLLMNKDLEKGAEAYIEKISTEALSYKSAAVDQFKSLATLVGHDFADQISIGNKVEILINGENAFPNIIEALENAKETIHLEYYIIRNDKIGNQIKEILIRKAKAGVTVRLIYDDFGSKAIRGDYVAELKANGVLVYPFRKIIWIALANRLNYRNHRKIIVVDGRIGFVGGINIGDDYINLPDSKVYHRDMHMRVEGPVVYSLQYIFLCDWQFCSKEKLIVDPLFPSHMRQESGTIAQIAASGPDSKYPMIMYTVLRAIMLAKEEILITTPYFVPSESVMEAIKNAALSGVKVKLLVPYATNSLITQLASSSYYTALMNAGVEIYRYKKGFIHAKTSVFDGKFSIVGTANMDNRSFNLNFEVNGMLYDEALGQQMCDEFNKDLEHSVRLDPVEWERRSATQRFIEKVARLTSSLL